MKPLSVETLLSAPNTRPVVGGITFVPVEGKGGKKLFQVNCDVREESVFVSGAEPRKPRIVCSDEFGHLGTEHQLWAQQRRGSPRK